MKNLLFLLMIIPSFVIGQNYVGESKSEAIKQFNKWKDKKLNWEIKDSTIATVCCSEYEDKEGGYNDTISVWTAKINDCPKFEYFFNLTLSQDCDSMHISYSCIGGIETVNEILKNGRPVKWRKLDATTFVQFYKYGIDSGKYRVPKMKLIYSDNLITSISIWIDYMKKEEYDKIESLEIIKQLPSVK